VSAAIRSGRQSRLFCVWVPCSTIGRFHWEWGRRIPAACSGRTSARIPTSGGIIITDRIGLEQGQDGTGTPLSEYCSGQDYGSDTARIRTWRRRHTNWRTLLHLHVIPYIFPFVDLEIAASLWAACRRSVYDGDIVHGDLQLLILCIFFSSSISRPRFQADLARNTSTLTQLWLGHVYLLGGTDAGGWRGLVSQAPERFSFPLVRHGRGEGGDRDDMRWLRSSSMHCTAAIRGWRGRALRSSSMNDTVGRC
jgi:hypothetical protein